MSSKTETLVRVTATSRLDLVAKYLIDANTLAKRYADMGYKPYKRIKVGSHQAQNTPPLLEQARLHLATSLINCETIILCLMTVPSRNTTGALALAKSTKHLPKKQRDMLEWIISLRTLLDEANEEAALAKNLTSRRDLMATTSRFMSACDECLDRIDMGCVV